MAPATAPGRVLSTLNVDGSRRWLLPTLSTGSFWHKRRIVAYALMLLDLPRRQFTIFGTTFLPADTLLFMLLFLTVAIGIFLLTALFGRVWCGWGCPQTV